MTETPHTAGTPSVDPTPVDPTPSTGWASAARRWSQRGHRVARRATLVGGAMFVLGVTGAAAAGVGPWSEPDRPSLDAASGANHGGAPSAPLTLVGDAGGDSGRPGGAAPTTALPVTVAASAAGEPTPADPGGSSPATTGTTPSDAEPVATAAPIPVDPATTAAPAVEPPTPTTEHHDPVPPTAPTTVHHEPASTEPASTEPAPSGPGTSTSGDPGPATPVTAAPEPAPSEPTSSDAPTTTAHVEHHAPTTLALSCSLGGDAGDVTVACHWSGSVPDGFARYLVLRGQVGGKGRVVFASSDPAASDSLDHGLEAGQYSYVVVELDSANQTLGHSNPVSIVVAGAAG